MRTHRSRSRLSALALLVVVASLALTATVARGLEPTPITPIAATAFGPVVLPSAASSAQLGLRPLTEPAFETPPPVRPQPALPAPRAIVVPFVQTLHHSLGGRASWYCNADDPSGPLSVCRSGYPDGPGFDAYGAAGPGLRAALGAGWRNQVVYVCGRTCVRVRLIDWCKCTGGSVGVVKLIDLYYDVYVRTGSDITIRW